MHHLFHFFNGIVAVGGEPEPPFPHHRGNPGCYLLQPADAYAKYGMYYIKAAMEGVRALNAKHAPDGPPRFFVLHRKRLHNASEGCGMGWEPAIMGTGPQA